jgi:maltooligosyltrehalose trehalohydrolase
MTRVWAPAARRVELIADGDRTPMAEEDGGWFTSPTPLPPGTDYAFVLDGGEPLPDPRAPWLPHGVHGPGRTVDHGAFDWSDEGWHGFHLASAVLYELHTGTFTPDGTFDAAIGTLDHLVELGVTAIEIMPVAQFPGVHGWGYDGVGLFAPHHPYGGPDGLKRLVDASHALGLGVILDVVYNHLGPSGNHLAKFGPYFTDRYSTPWGDAVNLDGPGSDEVRALILDNARMWLRDYHIDALRLDAVHALVDCSAVHILEQLAADVERLGATLDRPLHLIAETDRNDPRVIRSREAGGYGLAAQWCDDMHHVLHAALTDERDGYYADYSGEVADIAYVMRHAYLFDGRWSPHRGRTHGRPADDLPGHRFVVALQNHDQVGNRAAGERTTHLLSVARRKIGAALLLVSPFTPMLFQGEEWSAGSPFLYFTDHDDAELGRAVSDGRRREFAAFGWAPDEVPDPQDPESHRRSILDWDELHDGEHAELLEWHRRLIALRRSTPDLLDGALDRVQAHADDKARTLVIERGVITLVCNLGHADASIEVRPGSLTLASEPAVALDGRTLSLPPDSVAVLSTS